MTWNPPTEPEIKTLLQNSQTVAIVGVSAKEDRASYQVARYLKENSHFTLYFVNPLLEEVLGEKVYPALSDIPVHIDIVDVFRKAEDCLPIAQEAIAIGASAIWLQLGIANNEVSSKATSAGLDVVMDRCIKIDYAPLITK
jgi:predicted CoA-binding protein